MMRLSALLGLLMLLTACGGDGNGSANQPQPGGNLSPTAQNPGSQPDDPGRGPVTAAVTKSIDMEWQVHKADGGLVTDVVSRGESLLAAVDHEVAVRDPATGKWRSTGVPVHENFLVTADGYIYTDRGYRLVPGESEWQELSFDSRLWLGEDGLTLYRRGDSEKGEEAKLFVSHDNSDTWKAVEVPIDNVAQLAEFKGDLYLAEGYGGIWRQRADETRWTEVARIGSFTFNLLVTPDGQLVALSRGVWISANGKEWQEIEIGDSYIDRVLGRDLEGNPLFLKLNTVYRLVDSRLEPVIESTRASVILSAFQVDQDTFLFGGFNGLWRVENTAQGKNETLIGIPGDRVGRIFHLHTGTYASVHAGPGMGHWARFDSASGKWIREAFSETGVVDVAALADGSYLLAATSAYEGGYGSINRWWPETGKVLVSHGAPSLSVAVNDSGHWFVSTGNYMEGDNYRVLVSDDEGQSWHDTKFEGSGENWLAWYCGEMILGGADGLRFFDRNRSKWSEPNPYYAFEGLESKDEHFLVYTRERLWHMASCDGTLEPVALPPDTELINVAIDDDGSLWATTNQGGIYLANGKTEWQSFSTALPEGDLGNISIDQNGTIWVRVKGEGTFAGERY